LRPGRIGDLRKMAQRATVLVEKEAPAHKRAGRGSRGSAPPPRAIPVDLRKVVAPYRNGGRLTIRVEHMPPLARFSAGRNNGDNSWSFALDELEDLLYLPGSALDEPQTLAVRIISHDSTIALVDYEIAPEISIAMVEPGAPGAAALEQLRRLRDELSDMTLRLASAPSKAEGAIREALAKAEERWKAAETARFAAAEARLREQSEKALADARAATQKTAGANRGELERLNGELATLREKLAGRDGELVQLRAGLSKAPAEAEKAMRDALCAAEERWKANEAVRLAAAEAQWRQQSERALAAARDAAQKALDGEKSEREKLSGELDALRAQLSERESDVAKLQSAVLQAGARQERNLQDALETWKAGETVRLQAAEAHWKTQAAEMRAQMQAEAARAEAQARAQSAALSAQHESELRRLESELAGTRQTLAAREAELGLSRANVVQTQARAEKDIDMARATAERESRERFSAKLAEAVARYEAAEAALSNMRRRTHSQSAEEATVLRDEINALRTVLANRDAEIAQFRLANVQTNAYDGGDHADNRSFVFGALALACAVMAAILFYPQIVAQLPYDWQVEIASFTGGITYDSNDAPAANPPPPAGAPAAQAQATAIVIRGANLRAGGSTKGGVLMTLAAGTEVSEIRQSGNWTLVEARAGQKTQTGWVYNSFLKPKDADPKAGGN